MDREIPKEVRQKERNKKIIRYSAIGVAGVIVVSVLISLMRVGVEEKDIVFLHRTRMPKFIFLIVVAKAMMMKEAIGRWEVIVSTF